MPLLFTPSAGPVATITNAYSAGGTQSPSGLTGNTGNNMAVVVAPGAYTANTLQTVISHTGRGRVNMLTVYTGNTTSRTLRCRITLDGTVVFDATTNAIITSGVGMVPIGILTSATPLLIGMQPIDYQSSLLVEVASSLSEAAANVGISVNREIWSS